MKTFLGSPNQIHEGKAGRHCNLVTGKGINEGGWRWREEEMKLFTEIWSEECTGKNSEMATPSRVDEREKI